MPYLFTGLVIVNVLALGYFTFLHQPTSTQSLNEAKESISQPLSFKNNSVKAPPLIGAKD